MNYMREPTAREARQILTEWAAKQAAVSAERDIVIRQAIRAGLAKMDVHRLTGVARTTVDRIVESRADRPATAPSEASRS
jgi:hypothetical protein